MENKHQDDVNRKMKLVEVRTTIVFEEEDVKNIEIIKKHERVKSITQVAITAIKEKADRIKKEWGE